MAIEDAVAHQSDRSAVRGRILDAMEKRQSNGWKCLKTGSKVDPA